MSYKKAIFGLMFSALTPFGAVANAQAAHLAPDIADQKVGAYTFTVGNAQITAF